MTAAQLLDKMADLESRIALIYERFVTQFRQALAVGDLWQSMGREELHHADLLSRMDRGSGATMDAQLEDHVRRLEAVVSRCESEQAQIDSLPQALAVTADLEEAEAEHLHNVLNELGPGGRELAANPALQHHTRGLLEYAIELYGDAALRQRLAWKSFRG
ncbi:MAG: hypothetical protein HY270_22750 [Deltaproteobacteria bacterium]|nr:hypothetical protein [Deltaproteobacteria bacterium]